MILVGVAGWACRDWHGLLHPKPKPRGFDPLHFLARYVKVIEINSSFYGPPKPATARRWLERVSDREVTKAPALLAASYADAFEAVGVRAED
jgi:uncharacterized protein YecE (DUF72 family)